jgi:hypothetical protein
LLLIDGNVGYMDNEGEKGVKMEECEFADFGWHPCVGEIAPSEWTEGITVCVAHEGFVAGRAYEAWLHPQPLTSGPRRAFGRLLRQALGR